MPALSFSLDWKRVKIESGEIRQTIRLARKRPIKVGDKLYLYWKMRTKECCSILIGSTDLLKGYYTVGCTESYRLPWDSLGEGVALLDGFDSYTTFRAFFETHYHPQPDTLFDIVRW